MFEKFIKDQPVLTSLALVGTSVTLLIYVGVSCLTMLHAVMMVENGGRHVATGFLFIGLMVSGILIFKTYLRLADVRHLSNELRHDLNKEFEGRQIRCRQMNRDAYLVMAGLRILAFNQAVTDVQGISKKSQFKDLNEFRSYHELQQILVEAGLGKEVTVESLADFLLQSTEKYLNSEPSYRR